MPFETSKCLDASKHSFHGWQGPAFGTGGVLTKTATGTEAWRKTLSGVVNAGANAPTDMARASSGFAYVSDAQDGVSTVVALVGDDGSEQWTRVIHGIGWGHVAVTTDGQIVVAGGASSAVDAGSGPVDPPRPFEDFTVIVVFGSDGSLVSTHFLDGSFAPGAVAAGLVSTRCPRRCAAVLSAARATRNVSS